MDVPKPAKGPRKRTKAYVFPRKPPHTAALTARPPARLARAISRGAPPPAAAADQGERKPTELRSEVRASKLPVGRSKPAPIIQAETARLVGQLKRLNSSPLGPCVSRHPARYGPPRILRVTPRAAIRDSR